MKTAKSNGIVFWVVFFALTFVIFFTLVGYFRAAELNSSSTLTEARALSQLKILQDNLKQTEAVDDAKRHLKAFESAVGFSAESNEMEHIKQTYNPIIAHFGIKPKETDEKFLLGKKKDLMEGIVNAYRKEIPNGDIPIRAALLNILFDTQASLLNESDEAESVYIKRNKDRFASLKSIAAASKDESKISRMAVLDAAFAFYEKSFNSGSEWRIKKNSLLTEVDKNLNMLSKQIRAEDNQVVAETRRSFLYTAIISLFVIVGCFVAVMIGQKIARLRFETLSDALSLLLKEFGTEGSHDQRALTVLKSDEDWTKLLNNVIETEKNFTNQNQAMLAIPKSMKMPYLVFDKNRSMVTHNDGARRFFDWSGNNVLFDDLLRKTEIEVREGDRQRILEVIIRSFNSSKQEVFEILMTEAGQWIPIEFILSPITSGNLTGGKVLILRPIPNEIARIEKAVVNQVSRVRDYVQGISKFKNIDIQISEQDILPIRETIIDLQNLKMSLDERETLWKSEAQGLNDQISRQREILMRLSLEIQTVNEDYEQLINLLQMIRGTDESVHEEISTIEGDLNKWVDNRQRLSSDLQAHAEVVKKAKEIELQIRKSSDEVKTSVQSFYQELESLKGYYQEVKLYAVNLSFTDEPKEKEFAAKARAFSINVGKYTDLMSNILRTLTEFINKHPAGTLFPNLESADISPTVLDNLKEEQNKWSTFLKKWKSSTKEILDRESQAIELAVEADKKSNMVAQLGETSIVINDQARNNLERWH